MSNDEHAPQANIMLELDGDDPTTDRTAESYDHDEPMLAELGDTLPRAGQAIPVRHATSLNKDTAGTTLPQEE